MIRVCIPTFNRASRLALQLRQLAFARQLGALLDIHVFDNASTDGTAALVGPAVASGEISWHPNSSNMGAAANMKRILYHCAANWGTTSDYFWILSDDDYVFPANVAALSERLKALSPEEARRPVMLTFIFFAGRSIRPRMSVPEGPDWAQGAFSPEHLHRNALISAWLYPLTGCDSGLLAEMEPWWSNAFMQTALQAALWRRSPHIWSYYKPVGIEQINVLIPYQLKQTFAIDRTKAFRHALAHLGAEVPELLRIFMGEVAANFGRRAVVWQLAGESAAASEAIEAVSWLHGEGLGNRVSARWLMAARLLRVLPSVLVPGLMRRRGYDALARLRQTQRVIDSVF